MYEVVLAKIEAVRIVSEIREFKLYNLSFPLLLACKFHFPKLKQLERLSVNQVGIS